MHALLAAASLLIGGGYAWSDVLTLEGDGALILAASRVPRTLALLLGTTIPDNLPASQPLAADLLSEVPAGLPSDLLLRRPDILEAEH